MIILSIGHANGYLNVYQVTAQDENEYGYSRLLYGTLHAKKKKKKISFLIIFIRSLQLGSFSNI